MVGTVLLRSGQRVSQLHHHLSGILTESKSRKQFRNGLPTVALNANGPVQEVTAPHLRAIPRAYCLFLWWILMIRETEVVTVSCKEVDALLHDGHALVGRLGILDRLLCVTRKERHPCTTYKIMGTVSQPSYDLVRAPFILLDNVRSISGSWTWHHNLHETVRAESTSQSMSKFKSRRLKLESVQWTRILSVVSQLCKQGYRLVLGCKSAQGCIPGSAFTSRRQSLTHEKSM